MPCDIGIIGYGIFNSLREIDFYLSNINSLTFRIFYEIDVQKFWVYMSMIICIIKHSVSDLNGIENFKYHINIKSTSCYATFQSHTSQLV